MSISKKKGKIFKLPSNFDAANQFDIYKIQAAYQIILLLLVNQQEIIKYQHNRHNYNQQQQHQHQQQMTQLKHKNQKHSNKQ